MVVDSVTLVPISTIFPSPLVYVFIFVVKVVDLDELRAPSKRPVPCSTSKNMLEVVWVTLGPAWVVDTVVLPTRTAWPVSYTHLSIPIIAMGRSTG